MKVALVLCALLAIGSCTLENFAKKQLDVLDILDRVHEKSFHEDIVNTARQYYPGDHDSNYKDFERVKHWLNNFHNNQWRHRDLHFNLFHPEHRHEAVEMYEIFMLAKDYDAFYKTACWAREQANQLLFVYAYSVAVLNRADTSGVQLPPMYEINPHYFTTTDVIQEAYSAKMKQTPKTIDMHFTGTAVNREQWVAYFGEDIGLNNHHFHWHADFPFWWKKTYDLQKDRKGELFFYAHHQLTARFDHERLSNYLPVVNALHWDKPVVEGFQPHATYKTEGEFPFRPDNMEFSDLPFVSVSDMKDMEQRILDAIDLGYITDMHGDHININNTDGINKLGEIIESSTFSSNPSYYGSLHNLAHVMLGKISDPALKYGLPPSVMEHFETATRDPSFFRLHKYMDNIFKKHKDHLSPYSHDELDFSGVKVSGIKVTGATEHPNELVTFFDDFEFDLTNALDTSSNVKHVDIKARVKRLNHESFSYHIDVSSDAAKTGVVRIFLAPKHSYYGIDLSDNEQRWLMVELDRFTYDLKAGSNNIVRKSTDSSATIPDRLSFQQLRQKLSDGSLEHQEKMRHCGHPHRMLLPKGNAKGMDYVLFVMVSDFDQDKAVEHDPSHNVGNSLSYCGALNEKVPDSKPMGFPFDRRLDHHLDNDNMKFVDVKIIHRK